MPLAPETIPRQRLRLGTLFSMRPRPGLLLAALAALTAASCRKLEAPRLDAVRALQAKVRPGFTPPADGVLKNAQIDAYLKVLRESGRRPPSDVAESLGIDPAEFAWVRARIAEGLLALDARQVSDAAAETYAATLSRLRETRRATRDAKTAARLDTEIAALEKERAALHRPVPASPASRNAALVAPRRGELERSGP
jgi:hypothetical protein